MTRDAPESRDLRFQCQQIQRQFAILHTGTDHDRRTRARTHAMYRAMFGVAQRSSRCQRLPARTGRSGHLVTQQRRRRTPQRTGRPRRTLQTREITNETIVYTAVISYVMRIRRHVITDRARRTGRCGRRHACRRRRAACVKMRTVARRGRGEKRVVVRT
jgi:hypothetical protein